MTHEDVGFVVGSLVAIAFLLVIISVQISGIASRLKEQFPKSDEE
jgi:hypothetical protein